MNPTGYPRCSLYSWNSGEGKPWVNADGTLSLPAITAAARYPRLTVDIGGLYRVNGPTRADVFLAMRKANPTVQIGWYLLAGWTYMRADYGAQPNWTRETWLESLKATNGIGTDGVIRWEDPAVEVRLAADIVNVWRSHLADFFFFDYFFSRNEAARRALQRVVHALRQAGCPVVLGNANEVDDDNLDGSMKEGFYADLWTSSELNVRQWREGRPEKRHDWLQAGTNVRSLDSADAQRKCRYAHGYGCMFDMQVSFGPDRDQSVPYHEFWADFYSVDPQGNPDPSGSCCGWLGEPVGPAWRPTVSGAWQRTFSRGHVVVNDNTTDRNVALPKGLFSISTGNEMATITVAAKSAEFLWRAR